MRRIAALIVTLALAACATPADRITRALTDYGLPERQARCMGERLQDKLSLDQLQRLNELAKANKGRTRISIGAIADQLTRDGDPKLVARVVSAGFACAL